MSPTADDAARPEDMARPQTSTRDRDEVRRRLEAWLTGRHGDKTPWVHELAAPDGTGMSSETLLFDVTWSDGTHDRLVARLAPAADAVPVFPRYELDLQFATMSEVAARSSVPVPPLYAYEPDPAHLGTEFLVMHRVDGLVPSDIPPYVFGSGWLAEATPEDRARLQRNVVQVLADLHAIPDAPAAFPWFTPPEGISALRAHVDAQRAFADWVLDGREGRLIAAGFAWLEERWPADEGETVLSWGDARIGNMMFGDDLRLVGVMDWEQANLSGIRMDLAWWLYFDEFHSTARGLTRLDGLGTRDETIAYWEDRTGETAGDLTWYEVFTGFQVGLLSFRTMSILGAPNALDYEGNLGFSIARRRLGW